MQIKHCQLCIEDYLKSLKLPLQSQTGGLDLSYLSLASLLIKDIKRLWPIHTVNTVQTSNMQHAFGVQVYGEVLYLEFYSVFSELFINDEILLCKRL